jgi:hypothetical protein
MSGQPINVVCKSIRSRRANYFFDPILFENRVKTGSGIFLFSNSSDIVTSGVSIPTYLSFTFKSRNSIRLLYFCSSLFVKKHRQGAARIYICCRLVGAGAHSGISGRILQYS